MARRLVVAIAVLAVLAGACGDAATTTTTTSLPSTATSTTAPPTTDGSPAASPLRTQLDWVLAVLGGAPVTAEDAEAHFDAIFLAQLPPEETAAFLAGVAAEGGGGPVELVAVLGETETEGGFALAFPAGLAFNLSLSVAADPPHLINGLFLLPADPPELDDPPQTWEELSAQLGELATGVGVLAAEVVGGACIPIHETAADTPFAIGSAFKLWVLGALAESIAAGDVDWDDQLAIREDLKSIPSGTMQDEDPGTEFSIFEYARLMISISDNTATDHLMDLLGREAVEAAQAPLGHTNPDLNVPMLTTRDLALLKLALPDEEVEAYISLGTEDRRTYLDDQLGPRSVDEVDLAGLAAPRYIDTLEWFATPNDLCRAHAGLRERSTEPGLERIRDVLDTPADQLGVDGAPWDYLAFKGGSEPGVLLLAVLGERSDGRTFVAVVALNDTEEAFNEPQAVLYAREAMRLLANQL